jgi:hypothetical protein
MNYDRMNDELVELKYWVTGYLHQDFDVEFGSVDNALDVYKAMELPGKIEKFKYDLSEIMDSDIDENALRELLLKKFDCAYYYPSEWKSAKEWFRHLQNNLIK